ncbi:hypothetical protein EST38_g6170 [Candolleomyces aberdarensis]|uniref:Actin-like ATPase domain-containing protein n=1 Tax=Candolleomyces aberdarensis TaxID=2316362 RepID=A0A4Q2DLQ5_9AGAR|nr:hypothetical protein EST38_g6170 [Candolleomyces aberdarensis]
MSQTPQTKGTSTPVEFNSFAPVVGINFGNSYASIAVHAKEGQAECIANEDGERQIACAISFSGEEMYIGNQAKAQLVKNAKNTIINFRDLLGKKFSEIPQPTTPAASAPVIQHPDLPDTAAYKVEILQPAPSPLPAPSNPTSKVGTPAMNTPRSEPVRTTRILTPSEVASIFLRSLLTSAEDFLGKKVEGAVITVPAWWSAEQRAALETAAKDAGIPVIQLLEEAAAAASTATSASWVGDDAASPLLPDRTQLIVDVGSTSTSLSLLSIREGLSYVLASSYHPDLGANQIDDKLIKHFATDFTKKTKVPLTVAPAPADSVQDQRAEARLRLAIEHTKRTISASPGAATCSVESLKDGFDYTGSINRMRFDMVASPVYVSIADHIVSLLSSAGVDSHEVDEIVYVGGTGSLPGLDEKVGSAGGFDEDRVQTPFARGTVVGGGVGDPTTILARGAAAQAALITALSSNSEEDKELKEAITHAEGDVNKVKATSRTLGLLFPNSTEEHAELGGVFVPVVQKETALPARRILQLEVGLTQDSKRVAFEVWEVKEGIRVEKVKVEAEPLSDGEDEEQEDEFEEVKHKIISKEILLGALEFEAKLGLQVKGKSELAGTWSTTVQVQFIVGIEGELDVEAKEIGGSAEEGVQPAVVRLHVPAPSA